MSILECNNINFSYNNMEVLKDLSFSVDPGDFLSIIGENGSGKTTLLQLLLGFVKPDSGELYVDKDTRKRIGYLPQQKRIRQNFPATVREIVLSGCINDLRSPFFKTKEKKMAMKNIRALNIENIVDRSFYELSGGQQQRVLMARALCSTDSLIILDEPVTGLDPVATEDFYRLINKINKESGVAIVMVSHDIEATKKYSGKILQLKYDNKEGSVGYFGPASEYGREA